MINLRICVSLILLASTTVGDEKADILIRGGTVIDGTGKVGVRADVGISAGRIVAVGKLKSAREVIDARGLVVSPGFIDLHSHADRGILKHRAAENYIRQGVTTLLCGNCGSSPVDVGEFFRKIRDGGTGPNIALLIGHGSVRQHVMGRLNVPPDAKQLGEMRRLVREAMNAAFILFRARISGSSRDASTTVTSPPLLLK